MNWKKILPILNREPEVIEPTREEKPEKSRWFYKEKYYLDLDEKMRRERDVDYRHWRL